MYDLLPKNHYPNSKLAGTRRAVRRTTAFKLPAPAKSVLSDFNYQAFANSVP